MLRYASVLILAMATAAPALAQPMSLTASVAVTWITDTYAADQAASEPAFPDWDALPEREDVSMGDVHHPAISEPWSTSSTDPSESVTGLRSSPTWFVPGRSSPQSCSYGLVLMDVGCR